MAMKYSALDLIGTTPLVILSKYNEHFSLAGRLAAKMEYLNAFGSVKDRAALAMIEAAEKDGRLVPGGTIIEATSGNTGIALAAVGRIKGYKVILTMPETMSVERRALLAAHGAELVLTEGKAGMKGSIAKAEELAASHPGSFMALQFENPANPAAHYATTGPEIWDDTGGAVDAFVAGVGTGGTISGTGAYLKEKNADVIIVGVEPDASPVLSGGDPGPHKLMGIGAGFVPKNLDLSVVDEVARVTDEDAFQCARDLAAIEGFLVGISSGAALCAATILAKRDAFKDKLIVVLLPDTGERYLSTGLFA